jgi:hypothetical protein
MTTAYTDVRKIMGDQEKTTQQKATDIAHYVQVSLVLCCLITLPSISADERIYLPWQSIIQPELDKAQALLFKKKVSSFASMRAEKEADRIYLLRLFFCLL